MAGVSEVASGSKNCLNSWEISQVSRYIVNIGAKLSIEASGNVRDAHVGSTDREVVADLTFNGALLSDIASEERAL